MASEPTPPASGTTRGVAPALDGHSRTPRRWLRGRLRVGLVVAGAGCAYLTAASTSIRGRPGSAAIALALLSLLLSWELISLKRARERERHERKRAEAVLHQ